MSKNRSVILMKVKLSSIGSYREVIDLFASHEYTDSTGLGFKEISAESEFYIVAKAVKKTPVFIRVFDSETGQIVRREEFIISEIDFAIDLNFNIIEIYTAQKDIKKLFLVFQHTVKEDIVLEQIDITTAEAIKKIRNSFDSIEIKKMTIKEFQYAEGVIGTYEMSLSNDNLAWEFIDKYKSELVKITCNFSLHEFEGFITWGNYCKLKLQVNPPSKMHVLLDVLKTELSNNKTN